EEVDSPGEDLARDARHVVGPLAQAEDHFGEAAADLAVMIDVRELARFGRVRLEKGSGAQASQHVGDLDLAAREVFEEAFDLAHVPTRLLALTSWASGVAQPFFK